MTNRDPDGLTKRFQELNDDLVQTQRQLISMKKERNESRKKLQQFAPALSQLLGSLHDVLAAGAPPSTPSNIEHLRSILDCANQLSPVKDESPSATNVEDAMEALNGLVQKLDAQQTQHREALSAAAQVAVDTHEEMIRSVTKARLIQEGRDTEAQDEEVVETELEIDELRLRAMEMEAALASSTTEGDALDLLEIANMEKLMHELDGSHQATEVARRKQFRDSTLALMQHVASSMRSLDAQFGKQLGDIREALEVGAKGYMSLSVLRDMLGADEAVDQEDTAKVLKVEGDDAWNTLGGAVAVELEKVMHKACLLQEQNECAEKSLALERQKASVEMEAANESRLRSEKARMEVQAQLEELLCEASVQSQDLQALLEEKHAMAARICEQEDHLNACRGLALNNLGDASILKSTPAPVSPRTNSGLSDSVQAAFKEVIELWSSMSCVQIQQGLEAIEMQLGFAQQPPDNGANHFPAVAHMMEELQLRKNLPGCEQSMFSALRNLDALGPSVAGGIQRAWSQAVLARSQAKWLGWLVMKPQVQSPSPWVASPMPPWAGMGDAALGSKLDSMLASVDRPTHSTPADRPTHSTRVDRPPHPTPVSSQHTAARSSDPSGPSRDSKGVNNPHSSTYSGNSFQDEASKIVSSFLERHDRHANPLV